MVDYCLIVANRMTFNLKEHSKYLDIVLAKPGIMHDVVFSKDGGQKYFKDRGISVELYEQGLLKPLPQSTSSQWFLEKEVLGIECIMVVVACPIGKNITDDDPDGFGCM